MGSRTRSLVLAAAAVAILVSGSFADGGTVARSAPETSITKSAIAMKTSKTLTLRAPAGPCPTTKKVLKALPSREKVCTYRHMIIGHSFPAPQKSTYMQRFIKKLHAGSRVVIAGTVYQVNWKRSYRKARVPLEVFDLGHSNTRYLVTCDTKRGYAHHHAKSNLIVKLTTINPVA